MRLILGRLLDPLPLAALLLVPTLLLAERGAAGNEDTFLEVRKLIEEAEDLVQKGDEESDPRSILAGQDKLEAAHKKLQQLDADPSLTPEARRRVERGLTDVEARIDWIKRFYLNRRHVPAPEVPPLPGEGGNEAPGSAGADPERPPAEVHLDPPEPGARIGPWARAAAEQYRAEPAPRERAAIARQIAEHAGELGMPRLLDLFEEEVHEEAREGIHEALVEIGGKRLAKRLERYAHTRHESLWPHVLAVVYGALERKDEEEPEGPWVGVIRAFHELGIRKLSLRIIEATDEMGTEGVAALGEILYLRDFGYHDHVIKLLGTKRDSRAVPPLVHKMNRFKFEYREQFPAHEALLNLGWYAVPELIDRLDDRAAGIWISWTLRKITGETMGTQKRKWHEWWKRERVRHPELFPDPEERPGATTDSGGD